MDFENYAVLRAAPGSIADRAANEVMDARRVALKARSEYRASMGALALWCNDTYVDGLVFPADQPLPFGWREKKRVEDGILAVPNKATKEGKNLVFALRGLPSIPSFEMFTGKIGGSFKIISRHLRYCMFERHGDTLFVFSPLFPKGTGEGTAEEGSPIDQVFIPEGCERVPLSVYYAAKEAAEAAEVAASATATTEDAK